MENLYKQINEYFAGMPLPAAQIIMAQLIANLQETQSRVEELLHDE